MSRPWLRVHVDPLNDTATINGPGTGKLIERAGGKLMWSPRRKAWTSNCRIASAVLALADHENREVTYTEGPR